MILRRLMATTLALLLVGSLNSCTVDKWGRIHAVQILERCEGGEGAGGVEETEQTPDGTEPYFEGGQGEDGRDYRGEEIWDGPSFEW